MLQDNISQYSEIKPIKMLGSQPISEDLFCIGEKKKKPYGLSTNKSLVFLRVWSKMSQYL